MITLLLIRYVLILSYSQKIFQEYFTFFSVPPQTVVIMDDRGQKLKRLAGPYDEGASLSLLCEAEGG